MGPIGENCLYGLYFSILSIKTYQGTLDTQELTPIGSKPSLGPLMVRTGAYNWDLIILSPFAG